MESPFGTFYTPNITPDPDTGIGGWTNEQFIKALQDGRRPDGSHYYPAFPYPSYTGISDTDATAIKAYLNSLEPVAQSTREHELVWYASMRWTLRFWNWLYLNNERFTPDLKQSDDWNRGAYLVRHLGHCAECHSPRTVLGGLRNNAELSGAPGFGDSKKAPNLTPHKDGLKGWSQSDWELLLEIGMLPNGDFAGGEMGAVVDDNTALLTAADRQAMIIYLRSLKPLPGRD